MAHHTSRYRLFLSLCLFPDSVIHWIKCFTLFFGHNDSIIYLLLEGKTNKEEVFKMQIHDLLFALVKHMNYLWIILSPYCLTSQKLIDCVTEMCGTLKSARLIDIASGFLDWITPCLAKIFDYAIRNWIVFFFSRLLRSFTQASYLLNQQLNVFDELIKWVN